MDHDSINKFVTWARKTLPLLEGEPADQAAESAAAALANVDERLGVEVSEASAGEAHELIVTAYSDPTLFPRVRQLVAAVGQVPGWTIVALKPPRGFDFSISIGSHHLAAETLRFRSIADIAGGVQLLVPNVVYNELEVGTE